MKRKPTTYTAGGYKLVGIAGSRVMERKAVPKSPTTASMVEWGKRNKLCFVARYWPSKKGWRALDIRDATVTDRRHASGRMFPYVVGAIQGQRVYPNEDALVMHLMLILDGRQMELL